MEEKKYLTRKEKALKAGNLEQFANSCNNLANYYNEHGKYQEAVKEYIKEAEIYKKLDKKLAMAKAQRMVGEMHMLLCEFDNAKAAINIYLKLAHNLKNIVEEQRAYATLGRVYLLHTQSLNVEQGDTKNNIQLLRAAEKAFIKSLMLTKKLTTEISKMELFDMRARCHLNLGVVKEHMGDLQAAHDHIEKAIEISTNNDLFELTHMCYISMSLLYNSKYNNVALALRYCNLALQVAKRLPDKVKKICETLTIKGDILIKAADFASAKQILTKAYKKNTPDINDKECIEKSLRGVVVVCRTLDDLITTDIENHAQRKVLFERLGDACCQLQNYSKAAEYYQNMLTSAEKQGESGSTLLPIYISLYQTYKDDKNYQKALEYLWAEYKVLSAQTNSEAEAFTTLCSIAEICELENQNFWAIKDVYQMALRLADLVSERDGGKFQRVVYARLLKLHEKHKMHVLAEGLKEEAQRKNINLDTLELDSNLDSAESDNDLENTPDLGSDIRLEELTNSDASDADETEKSNPKRSTRGQRSYIIKRNNKGETPLHQACIAGNYELVRRLLDQGHMVNVRDNAGWLPLHEACNHGHRLIVELLLERGAASAINDKGGTNCDGITPLYDACSNGYLDVVELLLIRGADATLKTDFSETCVDGLDKWRRSSKLDDGEQAQYIDLRKRLSDILSKVGIKAATRTVTRTESNDSTNGRSMYDSTEDCDDQNELDNTLTNTNWSDKTKPNNKKTGASFQYKQVMNQLRRGSKTDRLNIPDSIEQAKCTALLNSEEIDDDMWLIDDVGPDKKKCRYKSPTRNLVLREQSANTPTDSPTGNKSHRSSFDCMLEAAKKQNCTSVKRKLSLSRTSSTRSNSFSNNSNVTKQNSLLDAGFTRLRSESPIQSNTIYSPTSAQDAEHLTSTIHLLISPAKSQTSTLQVKSTTVLQPNVSFKIKVEDEMLLVCIERQKILDYTIKWLAEEAARRYYDLVGSKPVLRLKTADGFAFDDKDVLSVAIEQSMILATVLEWQTSSLAERYKEMCFKMNEEVEIQLLSSLQHTDATHQLLLEKQWYTLAHLRPLFKAILHQTYIKHLILSHNVISNKGCEELSKVLATLKNLVTLKLRCNHIRKEGFNQLLFSTNDKPNIHGLVELDISQNPLGNVGVEVLAKYCQIPAVRDTLCRISLSNCRLSQLPATLWELPWKHIDVSFNDLSCKSLRLLLSKLDGEQLESINLNYAYEATDDNFSAEILAEEFSKHNFIQLRYLQLNGCNLTDAQFYKIITAIDCNHAKLELLDITGNRALNVQSLDFLSAKLPNVRQLIALNCKQMFNTVESMNILKRWSQQTNFPECLVICISEQNRPEREELVTIWTSHWGKKKGKFQQIGSSLCLYLDKRDVTRFGVE